MPYRITYETGKLPPELHRCVLGCFVDALIRCNLAILRAYPDTPAHDAAIRKLTRTEDGTSGEMVHWQTILSAQASGRLGPVDCAAWRIAEGVAKGRPIAPPPLDWGPVLPSRIQIETGAFRGEWERKTSNEIMGELLEGLVCADVAILRACPSMPRLYQSGVFYQREPLGVENWRTMARLLETGNGDCEDLASQRTAEKRVDEGQAGARADFIFRKIEGGGTLYHIRSRDQAGAIEDPSRRLGMLDKDE